MIGNTILQTIQNVAHLVNSEIDALDISSEVKNKDDNVTHIVLRSVF